MQEHVISSFGEIEQRRKLGDRSAAGFLAADPDHAAILLHFEHLAGWSLVIQPANFACGYVFDQARHPLGSVLEPFAQGDPAILGIEVGSALVQAVAAQGVGQ